MAKCSIWADFKAFAMKGNFIDMAAGIIVGGAFGKIITSLVDDILMPLVGALVGGVDFKNLKLVIHKPEVLVKAEGAVNEAIADTAGAVVNQVNDTITVNYGNFIQNLVDFFIIAFCIFLVIRGIQKAAEKMAKKKKEEETSAAPAPKPDDVVLLEEIRDLLKKQK